MSQTKHDTIITLTLPEESGLSHTGTLLIQRGELAQVLQFQYVNTDEITSAIQDARQRLDELEAQPPVIPDLPVEKPKSARKVSVPVDEEPTIDVPLKKGKVKTVKISAIKIVGGEGDASAYRQAVMIAGRLIDGKLWDGETPIRFDDVYAVAKKIKHLNDKEFSLFTLDQFVQTATSSE